MLKSVYTVPMKYNYFFSKYLCLIARRQPPGGGVGENGLLPQATAHTVARGRQWMGDRYLGARWATGACGGRRMVESREPGALQGILAIYMEGTEKWGHSVWWNGGLILIDVYGLAWRGASKWGRRRLWLWAGRGTEWNTAQPSGLRNRLAYGTALTSQSALQKSASPELSPNSGA